MRFPARARMDLNGGRGRRGTAAAEVTRGASSRVAVAAMYTGGVANRTGWWEIRRVHVEGAYWVVDSP